MASMTSTDSEQTGDVLVIGASGQLGGMLRRHWPVAGELRCHSRRPIPGFIPFELPKPGGAASDTALSAARGVRAIICLAGVTPAAAKRSGALLSENANLALATLELAQEAAVPRVFFASSAAVYGARGGMLRETDEPTPLSEYGRAKLEMEQTVLARGVTGTTVLRIGNVAGADAILGGWRPGMQIDQFPDGRTPRRSYIGPVTFARVLHRLCASNELPSVLNLSAPGAVEMGALLDAAGLPWEPRPAAEGSIAEVQFDTNMLERLVDFAPENESPAGLVGEWQKDRNHS